MTLYCHPTLCMADGDLDGDGKREMSHRLIHFVIHRSFSDSLVVRLLYLTDYFVMWDEKIIHHLIHSDDKLTSKARRELNKLELPAGAKSVDKATKFAKSSDSKWLSKAQDKML